MGKILNNPIFSALLAAVFFGASAPLSKLLLGFIEPIPLAGFLYLGSGLGSLIYLLIKKTLPQNFEANITRSDLPWLAGAVLTGGIAAPILLMVSLNHTPASTASLLLNFESVATALISVWIFKEALGKKVVLALTVITLSSIILSIDTSGQWGLSLGALGILAACCLWGLDNNFTRQISDKSPQKIVAIKGLAAGGFSLLLSLWLNIPLPPFLVSLAAFALGYICYGLSITLFIYALRHMGAARTSIVFSTAPFIGFFLSILITGELITAQFITALPLMVAGTWLMMSENHDHIHHHQPLTHEHAHNHTDGHHAHYHAGLQNGMAHSHIHAHADLSHSHTHKPDIHHRHEHSPS